MTSSIPPSNAPVHGRWGRGLVASGAVLFVAAGALMWWRHADAVFASYLQAALAWCF